MFDNQFSNLYYKKNLININKKIVLIEVCQTIKCENVTSIKARKTRKTSVDQVLFETIILFCKRLVLTIKVDKSILKILINEDFFFNFALFLVSRDSKLLKRYAKKFETIKTNLIVH